ncbi:MAG: tetratricopeptide repeat protein, partial [Gammaproteobacteria bacterium]|nr:tetratricopeptide repeat protein [Gammaproteobacteria bacterium]
MSEASGGASGAGGNGPGKSVEERFRDAVALFQSGELAEAQGLYEAILQDEPGHADALNMLGLVA